MRITTPQEIVLIRHAESSRNVAQREEEFFSDSAARRQIASVADHAIPLSSYGWQQARETGEILAELPTPDLIVHSGYRRTIETTMGILEAFSPLVRALVPVRHHLALRERESGYTYDMTLSEVESAFPWFQRYRRTTGLFFSRPPGGESHSDVVDRVAPFLSRLMRAHEGERVWLVTHGGTLRALRCVLEEWDVATVEAAFQGDAPQNCSVTSYQRDSAGERLVCTSENVVHWKHAPVAAV